MLKHNIFRLLLSLTCLFTIPFIYDYCKANDTQERKPWSVAMLTIPFEENVGAERMPEDIAKVEAPFKTITFSKPSFGKREIDIRTPGAKEGLLATIYIQKSIDELTAQGGGTVIIPKGIWRTGRIILKSNINLWLADGAELHFSSRVEDYLPVVFTRNEGIEMMSLGALIYAHKAKNIAITGKGKLFGPDGNSPLRTRAMVSKVIEDVVPANLPVNKRIYDGKTSDFIFPPMFISPIDCENVFIEGITLESTPFWNIVPIYCNNVIIRGVTINSIGIPRSDGIDIESSGNVLIEYCTLRCGDDNFTIKAGRNEDGIRVNKSSENIVVRFCLALEGAGGVTCGSETAGFIRNVYVHDCVFKGSDSGIRFKTRRSRGGGGENLWYERIRMDIRGDAVKFDMLGNKKYMGSLAERLPAHKVTKLTPRYRNITVRDIIVENAKSFVSITGLPEAPVNNLLIEHAKIRSQRLFSVIDARNVVIKNAEIRTSIPVISAADSYGLRFENVDFKTTKDKFKMSVSKTDSSRIQFVNCIPMQPTFLKN